MRHLFILNPVAGGKKADPQKTEEVIQSVMQKTESEYEIYRTTGPMDACRKIREAASSGEKIRVYACGGDGTLNECVNGAAGLSNVALTVFPRGTGNDFIKMFGSEGQKMFFDLEQLVNGFERSLDLIDCNGRYSINICSVGIDARIGVDVHKYSGLPLIGGPCGYVVSLIVNLFRGISERYRVTNHLGTETRDYTLICACNGQYYGGGFNPVPEAIPDDGWMDVLYVDKVSRLKIAQLIGKYASGRYKDCGHYIKHTQEKDLIIESDSEIVVNVDGEALFAKKVQIHMVPHGIQFFFPKDMEIFKNKPKIIRGNESKRAI